MRTVTILIALLLTATATAIASRTGAGASEPALQVLATGLDQPKKITVAANGDLLVALSGDGTAPKTCTDGDQAGCVDDSGAIDEITPAGRVRTVLRGLPSISSGASDPQATGPVEAVQTGRRLAVLFQDTLLARSPFADLVTLSPEHARMTITARLRVFEARHNPDHGAGTDVRDGLDDAIDSDPYGFTRDGDGWAIADAGANDVLYVSDTGRISVLAVLPTIRERAAKDTYGKTQTHAIQARAQAVPTAVAVGPDGALYVGELGGMPFARGRSSIYRIVPGRRPRLYATGFTAIADLAFDQSGRLLVLELDQRGLDDPGLSTGHPASGALLRLGAGHTRTTLIDTGLEVATGLAVDLRTGRAYISTYGTTAASSGHGGEIVSLARP